MPSVCQGHLSLYDPGVAERSARCYLVYATAPEDVSARAANDALNEYVADGRRGIPVFHDHFTGKPHGGVAVFYPRTTEEAALLDERGPLEGWDVVVHALTFALAPVGFVAQTEFTLEAYGETSLDDLRRAEADDPRYWWRRH
jgi:hypothetical protein